MMNMRTPEIVAAIEARASLIEAQARTLAARYMRDASAKEANISTYDLERVMTRAVPPPADEAQAAALLSAAFYQGRLAQAEKDESDALDLATSRHNAAMRAMFSNGVASHKSETGAQS